MILRFWDRHTRLTLALIVVFICSVPAGHALAAGQALTLAHLDRPTPTPTIPLLDFENDVAQLTPGGPAPAEVPGAGLGLAVLRVREE